MMRFVAWLVAATFLGAACFSAKATAVPAPEEIDASQASPDALHISARDFQFDLPATSAKARTIDIVVHNDSLSEHEFMIVPYEDERYGAPIGEIEPFGGGETRAMRVQLEPGRYRFVCIVVSIINGAPRSHMSRGMITGFEVTP